MAVSDFHFLHRKEEMVPPCKFFAQSSPSPAVIQAEAEPMGLRPKTALNVTIVTQQLYPVSGLQSSQQGENIEITNVFLIYNKIQKLLYI